MSDKPILCLDFDGVLHSYTSGWKGADVIPDPPVPGAFEFLEKAAEVFTVMIYSSRSHQKGGLAAMESWLLMWGCQVLGVERLSKLRVVLPIEKPAAFVSLDDRALTFRGEWPDIQELLAFKPWNNQILP